MRMMQKEATNWQGLAEVVTLLLLLTLLASSSSRSNRMNRRIQRGQDSRSQQATTQVMAPLVWLCAVLLQALPATTPQQRGKSSRHGGERSMLFEGGPHDAEASQQELLGMLLELPWCTSPSLALSLDVTD
jgi:type II secretory pathway component PulK